MDTQLLLLIAMVTGAVVTASSYLRWRRRRPPGRLTLNGPREIDIVVKGGYQPAVIRVRAGEPVRLRFRRLDADPCAGRVYFAEPPLSRALDPLATTTITITPRKVGTHLFTCEEGRYRGHLVVEPAEPRPRRTAAEPSAQVSSAT